MDISERYTQKNYETIHESIFIGWGIKGDSTPLWKPHVGVSEPNYCLKRLNQEKEKKKKYGIWKGQIQYGHLPTLKF